MDVGILAIFQNYKGGMDDAEMVRNELRLADQAEPLGFDTYWPTEHHFTDYSACPDNIQLLSYLAGRTERIYTPEEKQRVYAAVSERARSVLESGRVAVLDGTFSRRVDRDAARRLAGDLGAHAFFVETGCSADVALRRLARRAAADADPSDAGPDRYRASVAAFEALDDWPSDRRIGVRTDREGWRETLRERAGDWQT